MVWFECRATLLLYGLIILQALGMLSDDSLVHFFDWQVLVDILSRPASRL